MRSTQIHRASFYSGPLPPPDLLDRYEAVQPGLSNRIVEMAERQLTMADTQMQHRHGLENRVVKANIRLAYGGLMSGFLLGTGGLASAVWLVSIGRELGGAALFITSISSLVGLYLYGQRKQHRELEEKRERQR